MANNSLRGKPVCVIGASTGLFGAVWAQAELRKVLTTIGANVIDADLPVGPAHETFDQHGKLHDPELHGRLTDIITALLQQTTCAIQRPREPASTAA